MYWWVVALHIERDCTSVRCVRRYEQEMRKRPWCNLFKNHEVNVSCGICIIPRETFCVVTFSDRFLGTCVLFSLPRGTNQITGKSLTGTDSVYCLTLLLYTWTTLAERKGRFGPTLTDLLSEWTYYSYENPSWNVMDRWVKRTRREKKRKIHQARRSFASSPHRPWH